MPQPVAVGSTNKIAGGGCEPECAWDNDMAVDDIAFAIEDADLPQWIEDVRRITKFDLQDGGAAPERCAAAVCVCMCLGLSQEPGCLRCAVSAAVAGRARSSAIDVERHWRCLSLMTPPLARCMASGHYLIRWGRGSNDYAATWGGMKLPVQVELSVLRNRQLPDIHAKYSWIQVRQLAGTARRCEARLAAARVCSRMQRCRCRGRLHIQLPPQCREDHSLLLTKPPTPTTHRTLWSRSRCASTRGAPTTARTSTARSCTRAARCGTTCSTSRRCSTCAPSTTQTR